MLRVHHREAASYANSHFASCRSFLGGAGRASMNAHAGHSGVAQVAPPVNAHVASGFWSFRDGAGRASR